MATEPVLGVPEMWPALLDHLPFAAGRGGATHSRYCRSACQARPSHETGRIKFLCRSSMNNRLSPDDEDDEVFDDEEFDEDADPDEDDEDGDPDDEEEEETWQVVAS